MTLTFDFNQAVAAAKHDYPTETAHATFIDMAAHDAEQQIRDWHKNEGAAASGFDVEDVLKEARKSPLGVTHRQYGGHALITMDTRRDGKGIKNLRFRFNHELGHIVANTYEGRRLTTLGEEQADCFAVLRGLKEGAMTDKDIGKIITNRRWRALVGNDIVHDSVAVLKSLRKYVNGLDVPAMPNKEVGDLAARYPIVTRRMPKDNPFAI